MGLWTLGGQSSSKDRGNPIAGMLQKELGISGQQGRKILEQRQKIQNVCSNLKEVRFHLLRCPFCGCCLKDAKALTPHVSLLFTVSRFAGKAELPLRAKNANLSRTHGKVSRDSYTEASRQAAHLD